MDLSRSCSRVRSSASSIVRRTRRPTVVAKGGYVLADPAGGAAPQVVLMSSGSEVALILKAHQQLAEQGVPARVVSMPSMELFRHQSEEYQRSVLPRGVPRVAIEAAHPMSWYEWVGSDGVVLGLTRFGASVAV